MQTHVPAFVPQTFQLFQSIADTSEQNWRQSKIPLRDIPAFVPQFQYKVSMPLIQFLKISYPQLHANNPKIHKIIHCL